MLHLHKHYLNFSQDVTHLAIRHSVLNTLSYLAYLYIPGHHIAFVFAAIAIFVVGLIETIGITSQTKRRLLFALLMTISGGVAITLGSIFSTHIVLMCIGIVVIITASALSSSANLLNASLILFTALVYITGSNFRESVLGGINYGIAFISGGLVMTLCGYLHSLYYASNFKSQNTAPLVKKATFNLNKAHINYAIKLSLSVVGSYLLAILFHLNQAYCVPVTVVIVLKMDNAFTLSRIKHRFAGTVFGGIIALILIYFIHDKLILTLLLLPINFFMVTSLAKHYGAYAFFLTAMVTISFNIIDPIGILVTESRVFNTFLGVCIVAIVTYAVHILSKRRSVY